jgi:predicted DNA binding CopG/RHH family protein
MKKLKRIPVFKSEDEEREFWTTHDSTEYINMSEAKKVIFPNLKPTTKAISIRMPTHVLEKLKMLANKKDIPYQSLLKMLLTEKVEEELHGAAK